MRATSILMGAVIAIGFTVPSAIGAAPQEVREEKRGEFVPRTGYRRTVDLLAMRRAFAARVFDAAPAAVTSLTGKRKVPAILIEFQNQKGVFPKDAYQDALFGAGTDEAPTVSRYYADLSLGQFQVDGVVLGWYELPEDDVHYEGSGNGDGPGFGELLTLGLQRADVEVDFGEFDNDGPDGQPNSGDDDGFVDTVFFLHAEFGAECDNGANIWSHSWHYSEPSYGHTGPWVSNDVRRGADGLAVLAPDGSEDRIRVEDYTIQPGLACKTMAHPEDRITPIGVITHEYGHALGLPDLYDRTPNNNPNSHGIGRWGLMAGGSWGFDGDPSLPTRLGAWSLARLGWAELELLDPSTAPSFGLEPVQQSNLVFAIDVPDTAGSEYFLVERKDPGWHDPNGERVNWDRRIQGTGLAVWHVDDNVGAASPNWPFAPRGQGQNDDPSLPGSLRHSLVALAQADCTHDLEKKTNPGDGTDLWTTGDVFGDPSCESVALAYDGTATGIRIHSINLATQTAVLERFTSGDGPDGAPAIAAPAAPILLDAEPDVAAAPANPGGAAGPMLTDAEMRLHMQPADGMAAEAVVPESAGVPRAPQVAASRPELKRVDEALAEKAASASGTQWEDLPAQLNPEQREALARASKADIRRAVAPERRKAVETWRAEQRRMLIGSDHTAQDPLGQKLDELRDLSGEDAQLAVQLDPSRTRVERVTGLRLAVAEQQSFDEDSVERLRTTLEPLVGEGVVLVPSSAAGDQPDVSAGPPSSSRQFQQVLQVADRTLPIWSRGATVYYDADRNLTTLSADTVSPSELLVKGTEAKLSAERARQIATQQLGLPQARGSLLRDVGEGVYLIDQDPQQARVVRRLQLPVSPTQEDLVILVDEETETVVGIE